MKEEIEKGIVKRFNEVSFRDVKAKFLTTTNERFAYYEGSESRLDLIPLQCYFGNFHTSYITKITVIGNTLIINTRNSRYEFEILEYNIIKELGQGLIFELSDVEIEYIEATLTSV